MDYNTYAKYRDKKHKTDYRVAKDTGILKATISNWKRKKCQLGIDKQLIIAQYLGISNDKLLDNKNK